MINDLQKMGGIAAIVVAATYIVGIVLFFGVLDSSEYVGPVQQVAFLVDNQSIIYVANLIIYVLASFSLVVLTIALYERLKTGAPAMMQTAAAFGLIWAGVVIAGGMTTIVGADTVIHLYAKDPEQAATLWLAVGVVQEGLAGGIEILGGIWILLISWVAFGAGGLPRILNYLGVVIGVAGILTVVPALEVLTAVFGLGQIVWFVWLGFVMLRRSPRTT